MTVRSYEIEIWCYEPLDRYNAQSDRIRDLLIRVLGQLLATVIIMCSSREIRQDNA